MPTTPTAPGDAVATMRRLVRILAAELAGLSGRLRTRDFRRAWPRIQAQLRHPPTPAEVAAPTREEVDGWEALARRLGYAGGPGKRRRRGRRARQQVIERHQRTCRYCEREGDASRDPDGKAWCLDHIQPISRGGEDDLRNIGLACRDCNAKKHAKTVAEWRPEWAGRVERRLRRLAGRAA